MDKSAVKMISKTTFYYKKKQPHVDSAQIYNLYPPLNK